MKLSKTKINLLLGLCIISMISVGFSSWAVLGSGEGNKTIDGNIIVDDVELNGFDSCISLNTGDPRVFTYYDNGFIHDAYFIGDVGHIITTYTINVESAKESFVGYSNLKVSVALRYETTASTSINLFVGDANHNIATEVTSNYASMTTPTSQYVSATGNYVTGMTFTNLLNTSTNITFTIDYAFSANHGTYFTNNIFPILQNIEFGLSLTLEGGNS